MYLCIYIRCTIYYKIYNINIIIISILRLERVSTGIQVVQSLAPPGTWIIARCGPEESWELLRWPWWTPAPQNPLIPGPARLLTELSITRGSSKPSNHCFGMLFQIKVRRGLGVNIFIYFTRLWIFPEENSVGRLYKAERVVKYSRPDKLFSPIKTHNIGPRRLCQRQEQMFCIPGPEVYPTWRITGSNPHPMPSGYSKQGSEA